MLNRILLIVFVLLIILTGCNYRVTVKLYDSAEVLEKEEIKQSDIITEEQKDLVINELALLSNEIKNDMSSEEIESLLEDYLKTSVLYIHCIYYCSIDGNFTIVPKRELPEDYDFRDRPPYKKVITDGIYVSESYKDIAKDRIIQTICVQAIDGEKTKGVIGTDISK